LLVFKTADPECYFSCATLHWIFCGVLFLVSLQWRRYTRLPNQAMGSPLVSILPLLPKKKLSSKVDRKSFDFAHEVLVNFANEQ